MTEKVSRRSKKSGPKAKQRKTQSKSSVITDPNAPGTSDNFLDLLADSSWVESTSPSTQSSTNSEEESESSMTPASPQYDLNDNTFRRDKRVDLQAQLVKLQQLYGYELFEECFVAQFVDLVTSPRDTITPKRPRSWMYSITGFLANPSRPSVKYCIRAAALAYYSVMYHNKSAEMDAVRWYLAGLESQRNSMAHLRRGSTDDGTSPKCIPDSQDICVPMMFSYFESMKGSGNAWAQHLTAAVEMIIVRGPSNCCTGHEHAMFRSVRPYEAFRAILCGEQSKLDCPEWCMIPFSENIKLPLDFLVDIVLALPRQLHLRRSKNLRDSVRELGNQSDAAKVDIERVVYGLLHKLQDWWWHFERDNGTLIRPADNVNMTGASTNELPIPPSVIYVYRDTLTATSIAVYNATIIVLYSVLLSLAYSRPPSPPEISPIPRYQASISSHSSSILSVAAYQNFHNPFCGDTVRSLFPLQIVALLGIEEAHRVEAQRYTDASGYNIDVGEMEAENRFGYNI